ncbi:MAG: radical SAM protein, partial [Deltaproteobacteria bacterium]
GRCNLMCKQCNIVESNATVKEASIEEVERIADNLAAVGAGVVLLTGGEPFLRKDLPEIVRIFLARGMNVRLQTAGMRVATPERLRACVDAGARDINVSLDSLDPVKQEFINSVPGSWHTAIETIAEISRIFPKRDSICSFGCVISRLNYREIPAILEFATRIGWYLSLVPVHITDPERPMGFRSYERIFTFRPEDLPPLDGVLKRLRDMKGAGHTLFDSLDFLESMRVFIETGRPTWRHEGVCDSPNLYFAVRPNGDFAVCCDHNLEGKPLSLLDPDFPRIFRSRAFRSRVLETTRRCPGCNYGSYPEMTLSARSLRALRGRTRLFFQARRRGIEPLPTESIFAIIEEIRARYP